MTTVIFQQIRMETDQVKMIFAIKLVKCAGRITVYTGLTGRFFVFSLRALGRAFEIVLGSVCFFECNRAGAFCSESCGGGELFKFFRSSRL